MQLSNHVKIDRIKPDGSGFTVAAGTGNVNSDVVDTAGWEGVVFVLHMGAVVGGAATSAKVQQGVQSNLSDAADLAGSGQTILDTDDNGLFIFDVFRPQERYVRLTTLRATQNATIDALDVIYYGKHGDIPVTQPTASKTKKLASPAEGTA